MLALVSELLDSLTQSSYKRQEAKMTKSKGFSDACNRAIAMIDTFFSFLLIY
jgi:hypothetical protein